MRADIHDGPEHMLQSEAGYIDARPLTPARRNHLQRTAGPYMWVKTGKAQCEHMFSALPLRADIAQCSRHVRFVPIAEVWQPISVTALSLPVRPDPATAARQRDDDGLRARFRTAIAGRHEPPAGILWPVLLTGCRMNRHRHFLSPTG